MLFCLLTLQLTFGISTVVGRSQCILQHNLWSRIGNGFMDATFVWKPYHFSIWETVKSIISVNPSLIVTIPSYSLPTDMTVHMCHQRINLAFFVLFLYLVYGPFFALKTLCRNDLFTCASSHQTVSLPRAGTGFHSLLSPWYLVQCLACSWMSGEAV